MKFKSVKGESPAVTFREGVFNGQAPDGSLYIPESIPVLPDSFLANLKDQSYEEIAYRTLSPFLMDEIPEMDLRQIIRQALHFSIPLTKIEENLFLLELFHGPTYAFKDVGARFMAHTLSYFLAREEQNITILVATSGDTGSAVAHGFFNVPHIEVYVLYPSGRISKLQEQQMTTLGGNIHAIEVQGSFDDCQKLVKQSLSDREIVNARNLTTANSINLGRLLPQITYYVWALAQWQKNFSREGTEPVVVVPSGNFGNLTAAVYAKYMGTPFNRLIAATNANDVVPEYLQTGLFHPRTSVQTYSNAMDVGNPSNLARLQALYGFDVQRIKQDIQPLSVSDNETLAEIYSTYQRTGIILDPHTAVGVSAARKASAGVPAIIASTAHPAKFGEVVMKAIGKEIPFPDGLRDALGKPKKSIPMSTAFTEWREFLLKS